MGLGKGSGAAVSAALLTLVISACLRATDNMIATTIPLLGTYVFALGTLYGGVFTTVYSASSLASNWFLNPRLPGSARRSAFIASAGVLALGVFAIPFAGAAGILALGLVLGLAVGILYPSVVAAAAANAESYRSERMISVYAVGLSLSLVLGPLLESYLLEFGYDAVFLVFGAIAAVGLALSSRIRLSGTEQLPRRISPLARRGLVEGILTGAVFFIPFAALTVFLPIYVETAFGVGTVAAYTAYIPLYVVSLLVRLALVARPLGGVLAPIVVSMVVTVAGLIALFLAPSFALLLLVSAFFGIPHGMTFTLSLILVSRTSGGAERNTANSQLNAFYSFLYIVVPIAIGSVSELLGIREAFLLLLAPVGVTCLVLLRSFRRTEPARYLAGYSWQAEGTPVRGPPD